MVESKYSTVLNNRLVVLIVLQGIFQCKSRLGHTVLVDKLVYAKGHKLTSLRAALLTTPLVIDLLQVFCKVWKTE